MRSVRCSRSARNSVSRPVKRRAGVVDAVAEDVQFAGPGAAAPSSTAEISTAGTTRTPCRSPAASASETPPTVSWSDSASSSTPASAARRTTSAGSQCAVGVGRVRLQVEARSHAANAMRSAQRAGRAWARSKGIARSCWTWRRACRAGAHGGVVAAGLAATGVCLRRRRSPRARRARLRSRRRAGRPRSRGPRGRPGGAELLLGRESRCSSWRTTGQHLVVQPALLGVGAQQQTDVGEGWRVGAVVWSMRRRREWLGAERRRSLLAST